LYRGPTGFASPPVILERYTAEHISKSPVRAKKSVNDLRE
jgi:hypothetical protein